jgi:hypothetical protein
MEPKVRIDPDELETLADDLERALEPRDEAERTSVWTDGFRASGVKHAFM